MMPQTRVFERYPALTALNFRSRCKFGDQLLLGFFLRFSPDFPIAVMDMAAPKISIERAKLVVMASDPSFQTAHVGL